MPRFETLESEEDHLVKVKVEKKRIVEIITRYHEHYVSLHIFIVTQFLTTRPFHIVLSMYFGWDEAMDYQHYRR